MSRKNSTVGEVKRNFRATVRADIGKVERKFGVAEDTLLRKFYHNYNKFTEGEKTEIRGTVERGGLSAGSLVLGITMGQPVFTALGIGGALSSAHESLNLITSVKHYEAQRKKKHDERMMKKLRKVV